MSSLGTGSTVLQGDSQPHRIDSPCDVTPATDARDSTPGLVVGADMLLPDGYTPDYGVHIRFNGTIGAVDRFEVIRAAYPTTAVLDCRGQGILSPGFINAHEHPAYSYEFPNAQLNPNYVHRDEWRFGLNGKPKLPPPIPYYYDPDGDKRTTAIVIAMELRHLLGGATTIAGSGGVPGIIKNVQLQERIGDHLLYDDEADIAVFPFSYRVFEDLKEECAGGPRHIFPVADDKARVVTAYVPHVGEGRAADCAAKREIALYLQRVQRQDRRYALVHGVAARRSDYDVMREFDVTLVWSPRSNLALYGETIDVEGALESGVRIALATDWSPSGSFNMKEEFKCARAAAAESTAELSHESLWRMATSNAAYALGLDQSLGAIKPGFWADLVLIKWTGGDPYRDVLTASDADILATWVNGRAILLSGRLSEALGDDDCVNIHNVAPKICGVFSTFNLSPARFTDDIEGSVPLIDVDRQASCG